MSAPSRVPVEPAPPAARGRTVIAQRVLEKIASQAAVEISAAGGRSGGMLGLGGRVDLEARPSATVQLSGQTATVAVSVGVSYPSPLKTVGDDIRRHVADRVDRLTGITVRRVDVEIAWLVNTTTEAALSRRLA